MRIVFFVLNLFQFQGLWKNDRRSIIIKDQTINIKNNNIIIDTFKKIVNKNNYLEIQWRNSSKPSHLYLYDKDNLILVDNKNQIDLLKKNNPINHIPILYVLNISTVIFIIFFFNEYMNLIQFIFMNMRRM